MLPRTKPRVSWFKIAYLILAAVAMYLLVSQLSDLRGGLKDVASSHSKDDAVALVFVAGTYFIAALTYFFLSLKPIKYFVTVAIQLAISTLNKLLPAGIGGMSANYIYLTNNHHTKPQAAVVVAANTITGVVANLLMIAILVLFVPVKSFKFKSVSPKLAIIACLIVGLVAVIALVYPKLRRYLLRNIKLIFRSLAEYGSHLAKLGYAILSQMTLTLFYVLALDYSLKAIGGSLPLSSVMLVYSFGVWIGAAIPAPGGVGSVEAGLAGGLIAFKTSLAHAVAAVLVFRLISLWLPLFIGFIPLVWSYRRGYLATNK